MAYDEPAQVALVLASSRCAFLAVPDVLRGHAARLPTWDGFLIIPVGVSRSIGSSNKVVINGNQVLKKKEKKERKKYRQKERKGKRKSKGKSKRKDRKMFSSMNKGEI